MSDNPSPLHATHAQLLKATVGALLLAGGVILITTVLPAEYGVDPTGIGKALGLTALSQTGETAAPEQAAPTSAAETVIAYDAPYQSREMSLTLQPNEGAEIKALMRAGESFVFGWATDGGAVNFDMHGEKENAGDEFSSYWKDRGQTEAHGSFIAPFDGTHGWYWSNKGSAPVTITLRVSGYFEQLYRPE
jgi:hypothetical protein